MCSGSAARSTGCVLNMYAVSAMPPAAATEAERARGKRERSIEAMALRRGGAAGGDEPRARRAAWMSAVRSGAGGPATRRSRPLQERLMTP
eukprot:1170579-Prymnesium_polylepis.2